jgi:Bacterial Ig domain
VNGPVTSGEHKLTIDLTNPVPLVVHVIAVSESDITMPPMHSAIDSMQPRAKSMEVTANPIAVPDHTLLLAWAKNEVGATASALDGYTLDGQSPPFLWGESKTAVAAGSYSSHFRYDTAIGYQTAIVGIRTAIMPVAISQSVKTDRSVGITLSASSPKGFALSCRLLSVPKHGRLSGSCPNLTYTPDSDYAGTDCFTFSENDGTADSNAARVDITVEKNLLIQGLDQKAARISVLSIVSVVVVGVKRFLARQGSLVAVDRV